MYKCFACEDDQGRPGKSFENTVPVCPCGIDKRKGPREKELIVAVETMHFQPTGEGLKEIAKVRPFAPGRNELACMPGKPIKSGQRFTGVAAAVNCKTCLAAIRAAGIETGIEIQEPEPVNVVPSDSRETSDSST